MLITVAVHFGKCGGFCCLPFFGLQEVYLNIRFFPYKVQLNAVKCHWMDMGE